MTTHLSPPQVIPALAAAAVAAALALAAPAGAHAAQRVPDAEIFATNNTAVITDPDDPRLDDRLGALRPHRHADRATGAAARRAARSCSTACSSPRTLGTTTFERSRRFDVDRVDRPQSCRTIAETIGTPLPPGVRAHVRPPRRRPIPRVDAIELEVPGRHRATRCATACSPTRRRAERLFGGSVTLDGRLILIADLADAGVRPRVRRSRIGGDLEPRA